MKLAPFRHQLAQSPFSVRRFRIYGEDAVGFLQGQSTQKLSEEWAFHTFLDRLGKIESHFILWSAGKEAVLLAPVELSSAVASRFEKYVISEDVVIDDLGEEKWWIAFGAGRSLDGVQGSLAGVPAWLSSKSHSDVPIANKAELDEWLRWQGCPYLDRAFHSGELINQTRLFEAAVDMRKGCFPGQEVVAKIHNNRGAAWAPVLLYSKIAQKLPPEIILEEKVVAKIDQSPSEGWYQADVLRDIRVDGMELAGSIIVKFYPRWPASPIERARELYHLGTEAFAQGDEGLARQAWELSISVDTSFADSYEAIGVLLGRQGDYVEAESWMRKLLEVDPDSVMAHTNLSLFLMRQDRIQEAEDHKAKATVAQFAVFGKKAASERAQKEALEKENQQRLQRETMFRQVLDIDPDDALANFGLATLCLERQQPEEARQYLEKVLATDPGYAVAYLALGKSLQALGQTEAAKKVWQDGVKIAAKKGEMMPANEMQSLLSTLG